MVLLLLLLFIKDYTIGEALLFGYFIFTSHTLIDYITSKLCIKTRNQIDLIMSKSRLGYNSKDDKVGILFPSHLIDFRAK